MKKSKNSLIIYSPLEHLKQEIDFRNKIVQYKKLQKKFLYHCFERHAVEMIYDTLQDMS